MPASKAPTAKNSAGASLLHVRKLTARRGDVTILDEITWSIDPGQHWVILGANGSGKTSLLSALTAYLTPTSGSIEVLGATYGRTDWRELRKQIGLVSSSIRQMITDEATALAIVASGADAILNPGTPLSRAARQRALKFLHQVEAAPIADRPWAVLSQGERQRVIIARALLSNPPLLILDEPCAGLDPVARERFIQFLDRLGRQRNAPTLILVTHHVEEIAPVFTHALLLKASRVFAAGEKTRVLNSGNLSETFNSAFRLRCNGAGAYRLALAIK